MTSGMAIRNLFPVPPALYAGRHHDDRHFTGPANNRGPNFPHLNRGNPPQLGMKSPVKRTRERKQTVSSRLYGRDRSDVRGAGLASPYMLFHQPVRNRHQRLSYLVVAVL